MNIVKSDWSGHVERTCCHSFVGLEHQAACPQFGVREACERHVPPRDWATCAVCPPGECRWLACEVCGSPIERIHTRIPVPEKWRTPRYGHAAGEAAKHIAEPADDAANDGQGEPL